MDKELEIFKEAIAQAKKAVLTSQNNVIDNRDNIQTSADIISQESIINTLQKNNISCKIYSEELEHPMIVGEGYYEVIIDPIDGSFMFLHGVKAFACIAMIVLENRNVKYALVQSIANNDIYYCDATKAYLNGKTITSKADEGQEPYLISGFASKKKSLYRFEALQKLPFNFYFCNDGGPLFSAMVASGNMDAAIEFSPASFHEFAGAIIAQKAGALIETIDGKPITVDPLIKQTLITARSKEILHELQKALKDAETRH
jgi:myo-inositol-1(or 4)-monophosphatase